MATELESYQGMIDDLREEVCELIADLPVEALNWRPLEGSGEHATNSLAVLAAHVAVWEHFWIGEVVGGCPPAGERGAEFVMQVQDASMLLQLLEASEAETRAVLGDLTASDLDGVRQVGDRTLPVRWCILHIIDHTALHIGHMQLTYQLWRLGTRD